ncbi:MAG TPA: hypothetical protein PKU80_11570 [Candidatus Limiplasma sp.]|nr:hypothetical protein [Candidatus Limiplasma sp.]HRX08276.1 hypothetical protein [Candidatus Limiplasma sp.]
MMTVIGSLSVLSGILVFVDSRNLSTIATLFRAYQSVAASFYVIGFCFVGAGILLVMNNKGTKINYAKIAGIAYVISVIAGIVNLGYGDVPLFTLIAFGFCFYTGRWLYKRGALKLPNIQDSHKEE